MRLKKLSLIELKAINKMFMDNDNNVISYNENYVLRKPLNNYDMNYSLIDIKKNITYLIDVEDKEDKEDLNDYEYLKSISWKIIDNKRGE